MTIYSVRCRNSACRHRRISTVHPDNAKRVIRCDSCKKLAGWRIERRDYNRRNLCSCSGPEVCQEHGKNFPHKATHPLCDSNPNGRRNQAERRGIPFEDLPLELMGRVMRPEDDCPF